MSSNGDLEERLDGFNREYGSGDEESQSILNSWGSKLKSIRASESFLEHPETLRLREMAEEEILRINMRLQKEEDMPEMERKALFRERRAHEAYRDFATRDVRAETSELAAEMDMAEQNADEEL